MYIKPKLINFQKLIFLLIFISTVAASAYSQDSFQVEVIFADYTEVKDGERLYLRQGGEDNILSESFIKNNRAILSGSVSGPTVAMLESDNPRLIKGLKVLLENTDYKVQLDTTLAENMNFQTQSEFHNVWNNFLDDINQLEKQKRKLMSEYTTLETDEAKEKILKEIERFDTQKIELYKTLGRSHPTNLATAYIFTGAPDLGEDMISIYDSFSFELKDSKWGKQIKEQIFTTSEIEAVNKKQIQDYIHQVQNFVIDGFTVDNQKATISPEQIAKESKKITILDFWASWCGPCRIFNNDLSFLYNRYHEDGLNVISYSLDANLEAWKKASVKDNVIWSNIANADNDYIRSHFSIGSIPFNLIFDESGKIIDVNVRDLKKITAIIEDSINKK